MKLNYTLTLEDFKAYHRLFGSRNPRNRSSYSFYFTVLPIVAVSGLVLIIVFRFFGLTELVTLFTPGEVTFIVVSVYFQLKRFYRIRSGYKKFAQALSSFETDIPPFVDIDDERIFCAMPGFFEGKYFWNSITASAENEKITLLYMPGDRCIVIPTSVLSPAQRLELHALIQRNVVRKQK
jgi:hypothetical protein